jgi:N-acetylglucosamine-6-sulfatase
MIHGPKPSRRRLATLVLGVPLLASLAGSEPFHIPIGKAAPPPPSFVFVLVDDMDAALGNLALTTTRRELGAGGTTFANAYVPISLCCPSRASILTGLYPHNHQIYTNEPPDGGFVRFRNLGLEGETVATLLQNAGYRTALFGKYLNGYPEPADPTYIPPGWSEWVSPAGDDAYNEYGYTLNDNGRLVPHGSRPEDYLTDVVAAEAVDFVTRNARRPYFLYLPLYAPHRPATPAPRHLGLQPGVRVPRTPSFNEADVSDKPQSVRELPRLTAADLAFLDQLYRKRLLSLRAVDELVGRLMKALRATGQLGRTYVIFSSDNGFHLGQHRLLASKYTAYEEDIRVPLWVRGPGVPAGKVMAQPVLSLDLAPTFAELAGLTPPAGRFDGRSLVPLWSSRPGAAAGWRNLVLVEQRPFTPDEAAATAREGVARRGHAGVLEPFYADEKAGLPPAYAALRTPQAKYVEYSSGEREYYDLKVDPYELQNKAAALAPATAARLAAALQRLKECAGVGCRQADRSVVP